ncbi:MAG: cytochrome P450 [Hyphomicrobiales bacterium]|nr:cytochrome P450 [Hyphomicrobiales bacterium]
MGLLKLWSLVRENPIAAFPAEAYQAPVARLTKFATGPLIVSDPGAIEQICVTNADNYVRGEFQQRRVRSLLGLGLLTAEGDIWQAGRRIATPAFTPRMLTPWLAATRSAGEGLAEAWSANAPGELVNIFEQFLKVSFDVISNYAFSREFDGSYPAVHRHMSDYFRVQGKVDLPTLLRFPRWVPTIGSVRARPSVGALRRIVMAVLNARAALPSTHRRHDLLDRYIDGDAPTEAGRERFIRDNVLTLLLTGHETTAAALAWTTYLLALFPWAAERVADEIADAGLGNTPGPDDLNRLVFTRRVMDEALRLYPPAPFFSRAAVQEDAICGTRIRPGDEIVISPWVVHRHRRLWEEPDLFAPDRFQSRQRNAIHRGAYIPFGAGPRICIGQTLAIYELLSLLVVIAGRFRFEIPDGARIEPLARITLQPRGGLPLRIHRR